MSKHASKETKYQKEYDRWKGIWISFKTWATWLSSSIRLEVTMERTWYMQIWPIQLMFPHPCLPRQLLLLDVKENGRSNCCQGWGHKVLMYWNHIIENCFLQYISIKWASNIQSYVLSAPSGTFPYFPFFYSFLLWSDLIRVLVCLSVCMYVMLLLLGLLGATFDVYTTLFMVFKNVWL